METGTFPFNDFLKRYDVWKFHPLDQGGRLVQLQLIGSEKDAEIVVALERPGLFAPWGDPIRWDRLEATEVEKSVWLNRWYYLPSFARMYAVTGNHSFCNGFLRLFRHWTLDNPVPTDLPAYFASRQFIWRDMQVAWRAQNLIWSFFLARHGLTEIEQQELLDSIKAHAKVLLAYFGEQPLFPGNHQSHGALALLHVAALFPEAPEAGAMQAVALKILNYHLDAAFFPDGNSVELCPGYYPFIAANFRDAYLLCAANGIPLSARWKERLRHCHDFMSRVQQPDGSMPPVNDSTEVPVSASLRILRDVLELPKQEQRPADSVWLSDSHQAVMRDGNEKSAAYLFLDAAAAAGSPYHWHAGKLGFHYWEGGRPCLVDSGICNYDESLRSSWYLTASAHNTVLVDGLGDSEMTKRHSPRAAEVGSRIAGWQSTEEYDLATMTSAAFQAATAPVAWTRQILFLKRRFVIVVDRLETTGTHEYRWLFHFAPTTLRVDDPPKRLCAGFADRNLLVSPFRPELFQTMKVTQGHINKSGRNIPAPVGEFTAQAADCVAAFLLLPGSGAEFPTVRLQQTSDAVSTALEVQVGEESIRLCIPAASPGDEAINPALKVGVTYGAGLAP